MKFKKIIFITLLLVYCVCSNTGYAITANDIIAYPVPFNPQKKTLIIGTKSPVTLSSPGYSVKVSIYDINGDLIIQKSASGNIHWNGRNKSGRIVKPGLYILKVEIENISNLSGNSSEYIKKIIRILIDY